MPIPSEREETLVEQLKLRDQQILEMAMMLNEAVKVMDDLEDGATMMLQAWNKQQLRMAELETLLKGTQK